MVEAWTRETHVSEWWHSVSYSADDLDNSRVVRRIAEADGIPLAFIQNYDVHSEDGHYFGYLPPGSRGLDQFNGDPAMLGRGHGPALLAQRASELLRAGAPVLAVDPQPDNARAIAVYKKVGFRFVGAPRETQWGTVLPMEASR